jgi:thiol-disulfide isomerase/thioredoxin
LALRDLSGRRVRLQDYRGRIIVLNFWATWCSPCAREIPVFVNAHTEYQSSGIVFIGASLDNKKTRSKIPEFVKKYGINFPILVGATSDDLATITLGTVTPATVFIDRNGEIVARILGELHPGELTERIDWLLGNRAAPRPEALIRHLGGAL